jgi:hypothetical protein
MKPSEAITEVPTQSTLSIGEAAFLIKPLAFLFVLICFFILAIVQIRKADKQQSNAGRNSSALTASRFRNPANGYEEDASSSWLWCFLFGPLYFALKGIWTHAAFSAGLAILTCGISWLFYPFFAKSIIRRSYLRKGWIAVE